MPAHSWIAMWFGPEKRLHDASTEISFREASGPENEKSNLRLPSLRAWNPRYRIVDFGSFINVPPRGKHCGGRVTSLRKGSILRFSAEFRIAMRVIGLALDNRSFFVWRDSDTTTFAPYPELSACVFDFCFHRLSWFHLV